MIEYAKVILPQVIFSRDLFRKELKKSVQWIEPGKMNELVTWCRENFNDIYPDILDEVFSTSIA